MHAGEHATVEVVKKYASMIQLQSDVIHEREEYINRSLYFWGQYQIFKNLLRTLVRNS